MFTICFGQTNTSDA